MKFQNNKIFCTKCGKAFDDCLTECPNCHHKNSCRNKITENNNIFWLDSFHQGMLFLVGFLGFQLLVLIFSLMFQGIASNLYDDTLLIKKYLSSPQVIMSLNLLCYICIFITLIIILWPFLNLLFKSFAKGKTWAWGVIGGVVLIIVSIVYSALINLVYPTIGNENQENVTNLITIYPFASILLFGFAGPIVEEITYRVGCFSFLRRWNRVIAYILTVVIFALIHFDWGFDTSEALINELINIPTYFIAGGILCFIYERTSFGGSVIAHIINNMYACVVTLILAAL